jgi:hypothetical protein
MSLLKGLDDWWRLELLFVLVFHFAGSTVPIQG